MALMENTTQSLLNAHLQGDKAGYADGFKIIVLNSRVAVL